MSCAVISSACFSPLFLENFLVPLNTQLFKKAPIIHGNGPGMQFAMRQTDGGIELEHNVKTCGADSGNGFANALGLRYGVIDRVP